MFTHVMIGSNDLERARRFYDATFAALKGKPGEMDQRGRLIYLHEGGRLMITKPIDDGPATAANGGTIGISATSQDHVVAWHVAGTEHGGIAIESPPSERPNGSFVAYYPHTARTSLVKVLLATWRRYRKPIMVSETSWHDGHPVHHHRYPGLNKGGWLRHVLEQVDIAVFHGAVIAGVCWYPIVDCPPWHRPFSGDRWSHGLIRSDLSVDPNLSAELAAIRFRAAA